MSFKKINEFGWKWIFEMQEDARFTINSFVCPVGLYVMLSSISKGLLKEEAKKMSNLLNNDPPDKKNNNVSFDLDAAIDALDRNSAPIFTMFHKPEFEPKYLSEIKRYFPVEFLKCDFKKRAECLNLINALITFNSKGHYVDMFYEEFPERTLFYAGNFQVFKAFWADPFDPEQTKTDVFYIDVKTTINVPLMTKNGHYMYYKGIKEKMAVAFIPYKQKGLYGIFIRPDAQTKLREIADSLKVLHF